MQSIKKGLLLAVRFGVGLGRFGGVVLGVGVVAVGGLGVVGGLFVIAGGMVLGSVAVVLGGVLVMLSGCFMVVGQFLVHASVLKMGFRVFDYP